MKDKLIALLENSIVNKQAYASSSVVIAKDNKEFFGVNIQNAIYRDSISSEAAAISSAVCQGYRRGDLAAIYIMIDSDNLADLKYYNREMIAEFFEETATVHLLNKLGEEKKILAADLYKEVL